METINESFEKWFKEWQKENPFWFNQPQEKLSLLEAFMGGVRAAERVNRVNSEDVGEEHF
jgi:hypothetical protein